jgi:uroporphyrin-3 C-methyltransferase
MTNSYDDPENKNTQHNLNSEKSDASTTIKSPIACLKKEPKKWAQQWFYFIVSLIAIGAFILALNANYQQLVTQKSTHRQQENMMTKFDSLSKHQQQINIQLTKTTKKFNQLKQIIDEQIGMQNKNLQDFLQQHRYQKQDWLLLTARHYLETAQINANWTDNPQTTKVLLQQADELLQDVSQQQVLVIRQTIAKSITQINALPIVDRAGLLSQLDAAQSLLSQLPINQSPVMLSTDNTPTSPDNTALSWRIKLHESWHLLEKLIIVRHDSNNEPPIFSPLHQSLLRESIRMNLQAAQWAILQNNTVIYQQSLTEALSGIRRIFNNKIANTTALIDQITQLQHVTIISKKPNVDAPLLMLNQLIETRNVPKLPLNATSEVN